MGDLHTELKEFIVESLNLEDIEPKDIDDNAPLFSEADGLGLDSIDALELGLAFKKKYNIMIDQNDESQQKHFYSVKTIADYIVENIKDNNDWTKWWYLYQNQINFI